MEAAQASTTSAFYGGIAMTDLITMSENYDNICTGIVELLKAARSAAARNVNSIMTEAYWENLVSSSQNPCINRIFFCSFLPQEAAKAFCGHATPLAEPTVD
jgi:hypothetical protein